jgi:hypothetical protein
MKHGNVANKIRILPNNSLYHKQIYNINPSVGGSNGIHSQYYKTFSTDEEILEKIDIKVIEQFLRKKKLLKINNL